ncbi:hypothetical protein B9Z19DRAFT_1027659, partial [Tuber borchii]
MLAANYGHDRVVKLLLGQDVSSDRPDNPPRLATHITSVFGRRRAVFRTVGGPTGDGGHNVTRTGQG